MVWYLNSFSKTIFNTLTQFWFHWFSINCESHARMFIIFTTNDNSKLNSYIHVHVYSFLHSSKDIRFSKWFKGFLRLRYNMSTCTLYNNRILCFDNVYFLRVQVLNCGNRRHSCIKEYIIKCQCRNYTIIERNTRTSHVLTACGTRVLIRYICRALQLLTHSIGLCRSLCISCMFSS